MKNYLFVIFAVFCSSVLSAETWKIGNHISVSPPEDMDLTFQILEEYDENEKVLMGWDDEELAYLISLDEQPGGIKNSKYWEGIERELKNNSENKKLTILNEGSYLSDKEMEITYKIFSWQEEGEIVVFMHNLIKNDKVAYWVMVYIVDNKKIHDVANKSIQILKTVELLK